MSNNYYTLCVIIGESKLFFLTQFKHFDCFKVRITCRLNSHIQTDIGFDVPTNLIYLFVFAYNKNVY